MFSKACEYAIRATAHIARQSLNSERASLVDISKAIDSPVAYTAKILQQLVKTGIISSTRGKNGGFYISGQEMNKRMISEIVFAFDGNAIYTGCGLGLETCSPEQPCPAHQQFVNIRNELKDALEKTTVGSMALGLQKGLTFLKR
jgi:Rrf2 family protein